MRKITDCPGAGASNPTNTHGVIINGQTLVDECLMDVLYSMQELAVKANIIRNDKQDNYADGYQIYQAILALCRQNTLQERLPVPTSQDFEIGDFTLDQTDRELDLRSIVPGGAKSVLLRVVLGGNTGTIGDGGVVQFAKDTTAYNFNVAVVSGFTVNATVNLGTWADVTVFMQDNGKITYNAFETNPGDLASLSVVVAGWSF